MKTWRLRFASLKSPDDVFNLIVDGSKSIETRPRNPENGKRDYSNVQIGDKLLFCSVASGRKIFKEVTSVHPYDSVEKMLEKEDCERILPGIGSRKKLLDFYESAKKKWGKKYKFELENYGIVAVGFK